MPFKDYIEFAEPLRLPYRGKTYEIPAVGLNDAPALIQAIENPAESAMTGDEFRRILLGSAGEQMTADNVEAGFALRAEMTALADFRAGRDAAELMWETGGDPKAIQEWAATRIPATLPSATDEATSTPTPAFTSGTTTSPTWLEEARAS